MSSTTSSGSSSSSSSSDDISNGLAALIEPAKTVVTDPDLEPLTYCDMSIAFDDFLSCYTVRKVFKDFYRYGNRRGCEETSAKFMFCIKNRLKSDAAARQNILDREEQIKLQKKNSPVPSSLDVWELRDEPLRDFPPKPTFAN